MRVLITNGTLKGRSGTEVLTRNLAYYLREEGCECFVYSPEHGDIVEEIRLLGIPVTSDIASVNGNFDIIHGHHLPTATAAAAKFPKTPAIFVCHDFSTWFDTPPQLYNFMKYIAISKSIRDRLQFEFGIKESRIEELYNAVDVLRFSMGPALPERPRSALVFAKDHNDISSILEACQIFGIQCQVVGAGAGRVISKPEFEIPLYDLVFASGITALESMACGRAVILCDGRGLGGMVTTTNIVELQSKSFGLRALRKRLSVDLISEEIRKYNRENAREVGNFVRCNFDLKEYTKKLMDIYRNAIAEFKALEYDEEASASAIAHHIQNWGPRLHPGWPWFFDEARLQASLDAVDGLQTMVFDESIILADQAQRARYIAARGFSAAETWGRWTDGRRARFMFRIVENIDTDLVFYFESFPFLYGIHDCMKFKVLCNEIVCGEFDVSAEKNDTKRKIRSVFLERSILREDGVTWIEFSIENPASPASLGLSSDGRQLGLGMISFTISRSGSILEPN